MGFIIKASFWFGIVLLYLPENSDTLRAQRELAQNSARGLIEVAETTMAFCKDQPNICEVATKSSTLASEYVSSAADELSKRNQPEG